MEQWKIYTLECLRDLADADLQEREWGRHGPPLKDWMFPGPTELLCQTIDDSALADAVEVGGVDGYPETLMPLLRRFLKAVEDVNIARPPLAVAKSSRWKTVQVLAGEVLTALRKEWGAEKDYESEKRWSDQNTLVLTSGEARSLQGPMKVRLIGRVDDVESGISGICIELPYPIEEPPHMGDRPALERLWLFPRSPHCTSLALKKGRRETVYVARPVVPSDGGCITIDSSMVEVLTWAEIASMH